MKAFARILIAAVSCFALDAHAACELPLPTAVKVLPDGATSSAEGIAALRAEINAYRDVVTIYVDCIDQELTAAGEEASAEYKSILVNRRNAAAAELDTVAVAFNRQLRAFKAAHPEEQAASQPSSSTQSSAGSQAPPQ